MPKDYKLYLRGYVGGWDFDEDLVNYVLEKNKGGEVKVLINSLGGLVNTALTITNLFKMHGNVHCHFVGMNASAATIAAMGAKRITIDAGALFLVHKCMFGVFEWDNMNEDQLEAHIAELKSLQADAKTIDACVAGIYAKRCKKSKDELLTLMKEGAWLTAQQAKEWGFVDEVTDDAEDEKPQMSEALAAVMTEAGLPLPQLTAKRETILDKILRAITGAKNDTKPGPAAEAEPQNDTKMNDKFPMLAALLGVAIAMQDGKMSLSEDQAEAIEAAIGASKATEQAQATAAAAAQAADTTEVAALKEKITSLEATVNALKQEPAAATTETGEQAQDEVDIDKMCDAFLAAYR